MRTSLWMNDLAQALRGYRDQDSLLLCTPGHQQGRYAPPGLADLLNLRCDLTELAGLDDLQHPTGVLGLAQQRAARLWGADHTAFLVNGSTVGLQAMLWGCLRPGDWLLLPRNVHQAVIGALVLGGIRPIWLEPAWDAWGIAHGVTARQVEEALNVHPQIRAVLMVYPTYYGVCAPLAEVAAVAHRWGLPLLVDSAHGAHLAFHAQLPMCAVAAGADGVVQSTHKTAGSLTQSAMLHLRAGYLDPAAVLRVLGMIQSTSPSYLLLASLALMTDYLEIVGEQLWDRALHLACKVRQVLGELPGCAVLTAPLGHDLDLTRITLRVPVNGFALEEFLINEQIHPELSGPDHLVFILTPAHDDRVFTQLVPALRRGLMVLPSLSWRDWPKPPCPVTTDLGGAFFGPQRVVPLQAGVGRVAAQALTLYPPGIPLVLPGEVMTVELVAYVELVRGEARMVGWRGAGLVAVVE
ncbi:aminotransferase class I/II-fold pyridoxal phosphate-dependent enzyme [Candidatus Cyanaurora vandensis]|uniref:aminotransferase class I/II-fold pyridoxal phosphate-dependent enzyme n=1 Tax=Candidatus Cyanaurora vandensis TaxID=2714958 RepID=UPI00257B0E09|nr:DegT/DnrJ/EryC1/StrS family aminotransferase [Candidatus Cyanaurora vandensis]